MWGRQGCPGPILGGALSGFWQKPELSAEFWMDLESRKLKLS